MKKLQFVQKNLLGLLSVVAFIWWIFAGTQIAPLAFFTFTVIYGGYYIDWAEKNPDIPLRAAKRHVQFDVVLVVVMALSVVMGTPQLLAILGGVVFALATVGADLVLYWRAKRRTSEE